VGAAGAVVTGGPPVGPFHMVAGAPARIKKIRPEVPEDVVSQGARAYPELAGNYLNDLS